MDLKLLPNISQKFIRSSLKFVDRDAKSRLFFESTFHMQIYEWLSILLFAKKLFKNLKFQNSWLRMSISTLVLMGWEGGLIYPPSFRILSPPRNSQAIALAKISFSSLTYLWLWSCNGPWLRTVPLPPSTSQTISLCKPTLLSPSYNVCTNVRPSVHTVHIVLQSITPRGTIVLGTRVMRQTTYYPHLSR